MSHKPQERKRHILLQRKAFAKEAIKNAGFRIIDETETRLQFKYRGQVVSIHPLTGFYRGKTIASGRGIENLLSQVSRRRRI